MLPVGSMETVIFGLPVGSMETFIPMGVMYLHARMLFTLADTTSIPMGAM